MKLYNFKEVASKFKFEGSYAMVEPYGCGHINETFVAYFKIGDMKIRRYILQRVNNNIFKEPEKVMSNIELVTNHLREKILQNGGNPHREALNLIPTHEGKLYYIAEDGGLWRGMTFIEGARTYQTVENPQHFYNAGSAFGQFQRYLEDFPADKLYETISNFHNTEKRYADFLEAVNNDIAGRAKDVQEEIEFAKKHAEDAKVIVKLIAEGKIPLRVTHNDTKLNNIMIDEATGEGICVIDLDTVMPGSALYDYGDSIRFGASSAAEDERDLSKVYMDISLFEAFTKGFLSKVGEILTPAEIEYLAFSAKLMTYECGIRFLADHLNGDVYFRIHREGHNLDRARTQFKLVEDMEKKMDLMNEIVKKYI